MEHFPFHNPKKAPPNIVFQNNFEKLPTNVVQEKGRIPPPSQKVDLLSFFLSKKDK